MCTVLALYERVNEQVLEYFGGDLTIPVNQLVEKQYVERSRSEEGRRVLLNKPVSRLQHILRYLIVKLPYFITDNLCCIVYFDKLIEK